MKSIPRIVVGRTTVTCEADAKGQVTYLVKGPAPKPLRFNKGMLLIALQADGRRTMGDICDVVAEAGLSIRDPAAIVFVFHQLELAGAVEMKWHFQTAGQLRHECLSCGQSCEAFLIGPLSDPEVERLLEYKKRLQDLEPDLPDEDPCVLVYEDDTPRPVLNMTSGQCVFLNKERLCAIHKHFGLNEKPLQCRLFPLRVIETEDGFRVGYTSHCSRGYRSFRDGVEHTPEKSLERLALRRPPGRIVGLDPNAPRSLQLTPNFVRGLDQERFFLSLLSRPSVTLKNVIMSANGSLRLEGCIPTPYLADVARRLRALGSDYVFNPFNTPDSLFGKSSREYLSLLRDIPDPPPPFKEPPEPARAYLLHALEQFVFLREGIRYPSVDVGVHIVIVGILGALWICPTWVAEDVIDPELGERMAHWLRLTNSDRTFDMLFDGLDDFLSFRGLLSE